MAYGVKYLAYYKNVDGIVHTIRLMEKDYAGSVEAEWDTNLSGPSFSYGNSDSLFEDIVNSKANFEFYFPQDYRLADFIQEKGYYLIEVVNPIDNLVWSGFIESWDNKRPYAKPGYMVSMSATCGLNRLASKPFYVGENNRSDLTQWEIMQRALGTIGLDRDIIMSVHTTQQNNPSAPNPLTSVKLDIYRYLNSAGQWANCIDVVADILNHYNAQIYQYRGKWVISSWIDHAQGFTGYVEYSGGGQSDIIPWPDLIRTVNTSESVSLDDGVISAQGPLRRYTATADMGVPRNAFKMGSMQVWGQDGILGWQFNMGAATSVNSPGWWKYETGSSSDPFALRITGFANKPYRSTYKKWFLGKKRYKWHEPSDWIEPPAIKIKKYDGPITVSFDYYTEADSHGFLYCIWLESSTTGDKIYSRPGYVGKYGRYKIEEMSEEYTTRLAPPSPQFDPVTGRSNTKGTLSTIISAHVAYNQTIYVREDGVPPHFDSLHIRFYRMADDDGKPGDSYTIYNLNISDGDEEEKIAGDGKYKITIEDKVGLNEDGDGVSLMSGDYNADFIGATFTTESEDLENPDSTGKWHRRGIDESISIYRAVILDRLAVTWNSLDVIETDIKILSGQPDIFYGTLLNFADLGPAIYKIVRYNKEEYRRIVRVTCIEINYRPIGPSDIIQKSYTEASGLIEPGTTEHGDSDGGDGIYPGKDNETLAPTGVYDDETEEDVEDTNGRRASLFDEIPPLEFIVSIEGEDSVDLAEYFSEFYLDGQDEDVLEEDKHDPSTFILTIINKPAWVTEIEIEELSVTVKAFPEVAGMFYINCSIFDPASATKMQVAIPVLVESSEDFIESWPPKFIDIPPLVYEKGKASTQTLEIYDYLDPEGDHDGTGLEARLLGKPDWITESNIVFGQLSATGQPIRVESGYITYEISNAIGRTTIVPFPVQAIEPIQTTYTLLETGFPSPAILGPIPGAYPLPVKWDLRMLVDGPHDQVYIKINKGTDPGVNILVEDTIPVTPTELATYRAFQPEDGITTEVGIYRVEFRVFNGLIETYFRFLNFTLYDEEFLSHVAFELWGIAKIGDISIQDVTKFKKPDYFTPRVIVSDLEHDRVELILMLDDVVIASRDFDQDPDVTDFEYDVYATPEAGQMPGIYTLNSKIYMDGVMIHERQSGFEILDKDPEPESGVTLIEMIPNTANYTVIQQLPLSGGEVDLPVGGFNAMVSEFGGEFDYISWQTFEKISNQFVEFDTFIQSKRRNFATFNAPQTSAEILAFWDLSSIDIGRHSAPSTFRFKFIARLGGENGKIVGIKQADVSFRVALDPEDYSGIRFLHVGSGVNNLIDANMPKTGRTYTIPEFSVFWTAAFRKLSSGQEFDEVLVRLKKSGVVLHQPGYSDNLVDTYSGPAVVELANDQLAYVWGFVPGGQTERALNNPANTSVSIDEPGDYEVEFTVLRLGVVLEVLTSAFTLIFEADVPEVPESDCCGGSGEEKSLTFVNQTVVNWPHNTDSFPKIVIIIGGEEHFSTVSYPDSNNVQVRFKRPKSGVLKFR